VEVVVLGPAEVRGISRPFARAGSLDLVVYLAMHPRGASTEAWATALWPDRLLAAPTLHSIVSEARRCLGRSAAGGDHLPRRRGTLQLAQSVTSDWERLGVLAAQADPEGWREGLSLVRGRPFDALRSPDWTILEGHAAEVEDRIVQLAIRLAEHDLGVGDGRGAERAVRRALLASPYDERLYRLLLRAADLQGNPGGVESAMAELVRLVSGVPRVSGPPGHMLATPDAVACVHPRTADLYRALSRGRPAAGAPLARL
jgi:DNA-binding SARP family transcriptional activator